MFNILNNNLNFNKNIVDIFRYTSATSAMYPDPDYEGEDTAPSYEYAVTQFKNVRDSELNPLTFSYRDKMYIGTPDNISGGANYELYLQGYFVINEFPAFNTDK